ncbi:AraC family transcriptional regulator [Pseudomonas sp. AM8]|uniref:AraC family transcriptional regulator n=1 Tax=Pseudomonas sp. AM8 TaxID=2983368 RepID=UPI002E805111|nr:AraC family transcriptional regulator [Pseudomonas sp. AM8]
MLGLLKHGGQGPSDQVVPNYMLYGSHQALEDILHCERISDRAAPNGWVIPRHRHVALHQFIAVVAGGGAVVIEGDAFAFEAGMMVNIPSASIHEFHFRPDTDGFVITVAVQELPEVMRMTVANPTRLARPFVITMNERIAGLFPAIELELNGNDVYRTPALRALAMQLSIEAVRMNRKMPLNGTEITRPPHLSRFLLMIRQHLSDRWTVTRYANQTGVSRVHLNRLCQQIMRCSTQEVIENIRFQEACRLLTYSELTIAQVAFELGFDDPSYFSRAFRRKLRETPSRYRSQRRDNDRSSEDSIDKNI